MDYFSILNLNREPFSNSPDPDYFYHSSQHLDCLQKLELSLHLRRGLNVIIGDVGTGKTTLCRQIIRRFANRKDMETHLVLDPLFKDPADFLAATAKLLSGRKLPEGTTDWQAKEFIKHTLFRKGVDQKRTTILIIDEGQKIPVFCLELLREFLNYETNDYKLLQIVIFAQKEFEAVDPPPPELRRPHQPLSPPESAQPARHAPDDQVPAGEVQHRAPEAGPLHPSGADRRASDHRRLPAQDHQPVPPVHPGHDHPEPVQGRLLAGAAQRHAGLSRDGCRSASAAGAGAGVGRGARRAPDLGDGNGCRPAPGLERPGVPRDRAGDRRGRKAHRGAAGTRGVPTACWPRQPRRPPRTQRRRRRSRPKLRPRRPRPSSRPSRRPHPPRPQPRSRTRRRRLPCRRSRRPGRPRCSAR